ncbi:carbamoyltransferase C-terminal domain-containing protein [Pseudomonadota bacterium]
MIVIGIYDDHNASAALSIDGDIVCAVQEERFTKRKNENGFPKNAVKYILRKYNLNNSNIDVVALSTIERTVVDDYKYPVHVVFSVADHLDMMERYWKPKLSDGAYPKDYIKEVFDKKYSDEESFFDVPDYFYDLSLEERQSSITEVVVDATSSYMGVDKNKVKFYDHHTCHIMYGYFANRNRKEKTIGVTVDSHGDGKNQTVWTIKDDQFELISESSQCEIARLYRMVTLYLGMKPLEHEFKVMGLAPYAKKEYVEEVVRELEDLLQFDGLNIVHKNRPNDLFGFLSERLKYYRFDNIAGGVQKYTEDMLVELFKRCYEKTGIRNFVFSGGVAMNVKANKVIGELDFVDNLFVAGSSSDESQSIGACYYVNYLMGVKSKPLESLYLGNEIGTNEVREYIETKKLKDKYGISIASNEQIAELLAQGEIIARVVGRMEFGARALGNRSILANPSDQSAVKRINEMIKGRDFWMPFAATVMDTFADRYLVNPKKHESRFMAIAMETNAEHLAEIKAGTHPYDESIRPQVLRREENEIYYDLIDRFSRKTGIGALLNTSCNLHGFPMVSTKEDALHVFENSELNYLVLNEYLIQKVPD